MTLGVVIFDPVGFIARYPEFSSQAAALPAYFAEATLLLSNSVNSRVPQIETRTPLLWMLTAHIAALYAPAASGLVGRIASASEGSVSVSAEMPNQARGSAYYLQTKYGAQYWQSTARFRQARYILGQSTGSPPPVFNPQPVLSDPTL